MPLVPVFHPSGDGNEFVATEQEAQAAVDRNLDQACALNAQKKRDILELYDWDYAAANRAAWAQYHAAHHITIGTEEDGPCKVHVADEQEALAVLDANLDKLCAAAKVDKATLLAKYEGGATKEALQEAVTVEWAAYHEAKPESPAEPAEELPIEGIPLETARE